MMIRMKHITIYFAALILLLVNSCSKQNDTTAPEQFERYIFFSHNVDTKATLFDSNSDLNGFKYGVIGFKYPGTWDEYKLTNPKPNVFKGSNNADINVVEVTCDENGYGSYSPLQGWSNTLKYTFFAYYPKTNVTLFSVKDGGYETYKGGSPYISYSLNTTQNDEGQMASLKASMVDLMTGDHGHKDLTASSTEVSDGNVSFTFRHRMASLGVSVKNITSGTITLTGLTLNISGIKYKTIIIPLDGGDTDRLGQIGSDSYSAVLSVDVPTDAISQSITAVELPDKLIFIPQDETLSIALTVNYVRSVDGYDSQSCSNTINVTVNELAEGYKYLIPLKFNETTVEVEGKITGGNWGTTHTVNGSFN